MNERARKPWLVLALAAAGVMSLCAPGAASAACAGENESLTESNQARVELALLCLTNVHRLTHGAPPLALDSRLTAAARGHSADMVARGYFDHYDPEGDGPDERARAAGYPGPAGENIAADSAGTPRALFRLWRQSPTHEENMLVPEYRSAGTGMVLGIAEEPPGEPGATGTQDFGLLKADSAENGLSLFSGGDACVAGQLKKIKLTKKLRRTGKRGLAKKLKKLKKRLRKIC